MDYITIHLKVKLQILVSCSSEWLSFTRELGNCKCAYLEPSQIFYSFSMTIKETPSLLGAQDLASGSSLIPCRGVFIRGQLPIEALVAWEAPGLPVADWSSLIPLILTPGYLWGRLEHCSFLLGFRNLNDHWEPRDRKNEYLIFRPSSASEFCDFTYRSCCRIIPVRWRCWHVNCS